MKQKRRPRSGYDKSLAAITGQGLFSSVQRGINRCDPWFPWVTGFIYLAVMGYFTFRYHRIGGLGVETDFYVELVPQVKKLFDGRFSPLNYGAKGPVYSFLLFGMHLAVRDYFYAGLLLNLLSGTVFLVTLYFLIRKVFTPTTALFTTLAVLFNNVFLTYTYQAGSDVPFMAICVLSMYFLFRSDRRCDLSLSALFGVMAFLTRYNGSFIPAGAVIYLALGYGAVHERLGRIGLWIGVFVLAGLPWFISNWMVTGNPVKNDNYMNVMLEFYGLNKEGVTYENWTEALPKKFTGMGDIILYDPVYFMKHTVHNILTHFRDDMKLLVEWRAGIFVVLGLVLFWFTGADKKKYIFFSFGLIYFFILTIVFYNVRFSLYLLVFYMPLAVWLFMAPSVVGHLKRYAIVPVLILFTVIMSYAFTTPRTVLAEIKYSPEFLEYLKDLGVALGKVEPDKSKKIIGRKPHVAYYAGLEAVMFPENVKTVEELVEFCRTNGIEYIVYSGIEANYRPNVRNLLAFNQNHPGLERVYINRFGVIYHVLVVHK